MILYFSGTGNSEYAAKRIGNRIGDEVVDLFPKIRNHDTSAMHSDRPWVVVVPTYAWRIPRIIEEWLEHTNLSGNRDMYFVLTCGGSIGNAEKYLKKLCAKKNWNYSGCVGILMPENYIAMFSSPEREKALEIIQRAEVVMDQAAMLIKSGKSFSQPSIGFKDKISSGIVNTVFYPMYVHAKKFYVKDTCVSCGKCVNVCPLTNISLADGKPVWGKNCTHCMACICRCPVEAIEYGEHTKGLTRYVCPKACEEHME